MIDYTTNYEECTCKPEPYGDACPACREYIKIHWRGFDYGFTETTDETEVNDE